MQTRLGKLVERFGDENETCERCWPNDPLGGIGVAIDPPRLTRVDSPNVYSDCFKPYRFPHWVTIEQAELILRVIARVLGLSRREAAVDEKKFNELGKKLAESL